MMKWPNLPKFSYMDSTHEQAGQVLGPSFSYPPSLITSYIRSLVFPARNMKKVVSI